MSSTAKTIETKRRVVLGIDDDPSMVDLFRLILKPEGYEVVGAFGGREGLEMIKTLLPNVILLDLMMPDMDGWQVYETMLAAELTFKIPVIIVSAKPPPDPGRDVIYSVTRPSGYIVKPFEPQELVTAVHRALGD
jgi:two-component system response regulator VicR